MKSILIFLAIFIGMLLPQGHTLSYLIRPNLIIMLFFAFLAMSFNREVLKRTHFYIAGINMVLPLLLFFILKPFSVPIALAVFVTAIAPTAAASPVIADFLKTNISFVTTSILLTSPIIAACLPFMLPFVISVNEPIPIQELLFPILSIVFIPLLLGEFIKKFRPKWTSAILKYKDTGFYLFILNVYIASATAADFIQTNENTNLQTIFLIGITIALLCLAQFGIGYLLKRKEEGMAASLALGRKNTMFAIWLSLTFISPIVALGPMFYIFFQNMLNSIQLWQLQKKP